MQTYARQRIIDAGDGTFFHLSILNLGGGWYGRISLNPSNRGGRHEPLCSVSDLRDTLRDCWQASQVMVTPSDNLDDAAVTRIDIARDFRVQSDPGAIVRSLVNTVASTAVRNHVVYSSRPGATLEVVGGKTTGKVRLYDKGAERGIPHAQWLRAEVQARRAWCQRYADIRQVKDLSEDAVRRLRVNRWQWSGLGVPISSLSRFLSEANDLRDSKGKPWSPTRCQTFLGWWLCRSHGVQAPTSSARQATYRAAIRSLGVACPVDMAPDTLAAPASRLDYEAGREAPMDGEEA